MPQKIIFADQLRGVAAMCVVANHLIGVFWGGREEVAALTFSAIQTAPAPGWAGATASQWYNLGPFGVALFFLISGFVIPFSLARHTPVSFLAARLLRIFPVYLTVLTIDIAILVLSARYWHRPYLLTPREIFLNALLINDLGWFRSIDMINWTLAVEIKFYILISCFFRDVQARRLRPLLAATAVGVVVCNLVLVQKLFAGMAWDHAAITLACDVSYLSFMLIGVAFKYHFDGALSGARLTLACLLLFTAFVLTMFFQIGSIAGTWPLCINYAYGLIVFSLAYAGRASFRKLWLLDTLARISFPLYLLHPLLGYFALKFLMISVGFPYGVALALTLGLVLGLATLVHRTIEVRSIAWGRNLAAPVAKPNQAV